MSDEHTAKRAVLFMRVNRAAVRDTKRVEHLLEDQRASGRQVAERLGAIIRREYVEYGGTVEVGRRNELLRMLGDLLIERGVDYVITQDWTRLARHAEDMLFIERLVRDTKARIVTAAEQIDAAPNAPLITDIFPPSDTDTIKEGADHGGRK